MLTDRPPAKPGLLWEFRRSDQLAGLDVPLDDRLLAPARSIEAGMASEGRRAVRLACNEFLGQASEFYGVSQPPVRVACGPANPSLSGSFSASPTATT